MTQSLTGIWLPILWLVIGCVAAAAAAALTVFGMRLYRRARFARVFGRDGRSGDFHLVFASLDLKPAFDDQGRAVEWPYIKKTADAQAELGKFRVRRAVSSCETRAAGYLASAMGGQSADRGADGPRLISDAEINARYDLSFVSFGGPWSNYKTAQALSNPANRLVSFGVNRTDGTFDRLVAAQSGKVLAQAVPGRDFGLIIRLRPSQFPERVWLVCAGLGERGTSGAAWYLANRWQDLLNRGGGRDTDFAAIIQVEEESDESAAVLAFFKNEAEVGAHPKWRRPAGVKPFRTAPAQDRTADTTPVPEAEESRTDQPAATATVAQEQPKAADAPEETAPAPAPEAETAAAPMPGPDDAPPPTEPAREEIAAARMRAPSPELSPEAPLRADILSSPITPEEPADNDSPPDRGPGYRSSPEIPSWRTEAMPRRSVMAELDRTSRLQTRDEGLNSSGAGTGRRPVEVDPRPVDSHHPLPMIDTPPAQPTDYIPRNRRMREEDEDEDKRTRRIKEVSYV